MAKQRDDEIDYRAEGKTPPHEKADPTNAGYDEAVRSGSGAYGLLEGEGGVFGTSGGGTYEGGMHVEERPVVDEDGSDDPGKTSGERGLNRGTFVTPSFEGEDTLRLPPEKNPV